MLIVNFTLHSLISVMQRRFAEIEPAYPANDAEVNGRYLNQPSPARHSNPPPGKIR